MVFSISVLTLLKKVFESCFAKHVLLQLYALPVKGNTLLPESGN